MPPMKATIDIPDELYRRVKARTAEEGRRIRDITADLFRQWLDGESAAPATSGVPLVSPDQLCRFRDPEALRKAFPRGYRLNAPLIPARPGVPPISTSAIESAMEVMDQQELAAHARPR